MIDASCPQCGTVYHADQIHVGKHVRCTKCGFLVPILHGSSDTIVERPAAAAHTPRHPSPSERPTVRPVWRSITYSAAIASIAITLAVVLLVHFRHPASSRGHDAIDFSDIDQFVASQDGQVASQPETHTDSIRSSEVISGEPLNQRGAADSSLERHTRVLLTQTRRQQTTITRCRMGHEFRWTRVPRVTES